MIKLLAFMAVLVLAPMQSSDTNPYCGLSLSDFTPPPVHCPAGTTLSQTCVSVYVDIYQQAALAAYDKACSDFNKAETDYTNCLYSAIAKYNACTLTLQECTNQLVEDIKKCDSLFAQAKIRVGLALNSSLSIAKGAFLANAATCCLP